MTKRRQLLWLALLAFEVALLSFVLAGDAAMDGSQAAGFVAWHGAFGVVATGLGVGNLRASRRLP